MRKSLLFLASLLMTIGVALAQQRVVKGIVISRSDKQPVIGATVIVKGNSKIGAATDFDGRFNFKVPAGAKKLVISYVGYQKREIAIKDGELKVYLEQDQKMLDAVMVVAYGTATKNSFTGSASSVSMDQIDKKSMPNVTQALEGVVPGVQVFTSSGQPGEDAEIQIRGIGSVNSKTSPLYVVDGIPYGMSMNGIDASDIASMSVLKDASATALYGSRAANGVVLITTRKGRAGSVKIDAEARYGVNLRLIPQYEKIDCPEEFIEMSYASLDNRLNRFGLREQWLKGELDKYNGQIAQGVDPATLTKPTLAGMPNTGDVLFSENPQGINPFFNIWDAPSKDLIDPKTGKFNPDVKRRFTPVPFEDEVFRTGQVREANVKVSGGAEKITYYTSLGYQKNVGYYIASDFSRLNMRSNISSQINQNLKATVGLSYARTEKNSAGQGGNANNGFQFVNDIPPIYSVFQHDQKTGVILDDPKIKGSKAYDYGQYDGFSRPALGGVNPAGAVQLDRFRVRENMISANLALEYKFLDDFKFTVNYGAQYLHTRVGELQNPYYGDAANMGRLYKKSNSYLDQTLNQILSWGHKYGEHNLDAFIAHESTENEWELQSTVSEKATVAGSLDINTYVKSLPGNSFRLGYAIESYFGQFRYDYAGKYFMSASIRRDGSSRFAKESRWGTFGSVGFAWLASSEDFLKNVSWLNRLKFKASYGILGNQELSLSYGSDTPNYYLFEDLYSLSNLNNKPAFQLYAKGNPNISWEHSSTINVGFETELFKRLTLDVDYFYKKTTDMMFKKQIAPSVGYAYLPGNEGVLINHGIEFNAVWKAVKTKDFNLNFNINGGFYRNYIDEMSKDKNGKLKYYELQGDFAYKKGHSIGDFYMPTYAGVNPENGYPQWESYYYVTKDNQGKDIKHTIQDLEGFNEGQEGATTKKELKKQLTSNYAEATKTFVGKSVIPDLVGGFGFDMDYKGFGFSMAFSYGLGGYGYDGVYASMMSSSGKLGSHSLHQDLKNYWREDNKNTDVPIIATNESTLVNANAFSTRFLTSRSYLNLSNVRLSYKLPTNLIDRIGFTNASVYVSGDNLFLLSARKGFVSMSSSSGGSSVGRYLPVSSIVAGIKIGL